MRRLRNWCRPLTRFVPLRPSRHCRAGLSYSAASRLKRGLFDRTCSRSSFVTDSDRAGGLALGVSACCRGSSRQFRRPRRLPRLVLALHAGEGIFPWRAGTWRWAESAIRFFPGRTRTARKIPSQPEGLLSVMTLGQDTDCFLDHPGREGAPAAHGGD